MRTGRFQAWALLAFALPGATGGAAAPPAPAAPKAEGPAPRLTLDVTWSTPPLPAAPVTPPPEPPPAELELSEGRILGAIPWPANSGAEAPRPGPKPGAPWRLGPGRAGRTRVRVEAPPGATLIVHAGGQVVRFPIAAILDGPQQQVPASGGPRIAVERPAWDALEVRLGDGEADGTVAPGATVPVTVGFNVLTPEPAEVALRLSAELRPARGGEPIWKDERREVVATDARPAPARTLSIPAPKVDGTYVLELRATWELTGKSAEGSRLSRWVRRHRGSAAGSATRRVALAVVGGRPPAPGGAEAVVDSLDLGRLRGSRPAASGRTPSGGTARAPWTVPPTALVEAHLRDRLRGWIARGEAEAATLAQADPTGLAWSAVGLRVPHPDRPHRLTLTVVGGHPSALGIALVAPGAGGADPRVVLDACASAPPILDGGTPSTFSWLVWPGAAEPVFVAVNRGSDAPVRLGAVELKELADVPAPPPLAEPPGADRRALGLLLDGPNALDRFGGAGLDGGPADALALARNLAAYLASCGASAAVLPDGPPDRARRSALEGQAAEDSTGPDRLDLILRVLGRRGLSAWIEARCDGPLPGLPAPDSAEALARGLVRVDRRGKADGPAPAYSPLHPEVRAAMARRIAEAVAPRKARPNLAGVLIRLGPGATLPGGPEAGADDATFGRFARAMFDPEVARGIKGLGADAPGRFAARAEFLAGAGRLPWLTWRAREVGALYEELGAAARKAAPGTLLAVATPGLDDGPAGQEARRADGAGLPPAQAWRAAGLDLRAWPAGPDAPIVLREVGLPDDDLGRDLAASPDLDDQVAARPARGLLLADPDPATPPPAAPDGAPALRLTAAPLPEGPAGDEPLGHALAALDARWMLLSAAAVSGQEERVRRFARVFRALPVPPAGAAVAGRLPSGVVVRPAPAGDKTFLTIANDTPYPTLVEIILEAPAAAPVDDLGRGIRLVHEAADGGKRVALDLPSYGVAALRVGAPGVRASAVTPHHPAATLAGLEAQAGDLSARLTRLSRSGAGGGAVSAAGPVNPGFEPESDVRVVQIGGVPALRGWGLVGDPANAVEVDPDRPHSGLGSLRLDARALPASAACDPFAPPGGPALAPRAWLRADRPDARVRAWIEGEAGGQAVARSTDLAIPAEWTAVAPRVGDLPPGGFRRARLRFELLTPGRLWIDDVTITGPGAGLPEPDRSNARRTLGAALQAYRERRLADFARLANSRWARRVEPGPGPNAARPDPRGLRY